MPFIIEALGDVKIVPLIFGDLSYDDLKKFSKKLKEVSKVKNILVIVSTDLSHYHPYEEAVRIDSETINYIKNEDALSLRLSFKKGERRACGIFPLISFLLYSREIGADIKILKYANSGDTAGIKNKVVGYLSAVSYKEPGGAEKIEEKEKSGSYVKGEDDMEEFVLSKEDKVTLLKIARGTLENYLKDGGGFKINKVSDNIKKDRGAFVTLTENGSLRGCIGRIVSDMPLYKVISKMAIAAAVEDPRFPPVKYNELKNIKIEISVLTPFSKVEDLNDIKVGRDGLMIRQGFYSGLLLPQVPSEYGWDRETFLKEVCLKAGLPVSAYKDKDSTLYKFSAIVFSEK